MSLEIYNQRLDRVAQSRFSELKALLEQSLSALDRCVDGEPPDLRCLQALRETTAVFYQHTYPELLRLQAAAADRVFLLDCVAADLKQKNSELTSELITFDVPKLFRFSISTTLPRKLWLKLASSSPVQRLFPNIRVPAAHAAEAPAISLRRGLGLVEEARKAPDAHEVLRPHRSSAAIRPTCEPQVTASDLSTFSAVDNSGTAFEIFDNWVSMYHWQGRRFGAQRPYVTDALPHLTALNEIIPITGKRILEIGPFEGGNTKQMFDLGAASVTAIEANPEAYLKCALIKNEFSLDSFSIIYGDCNQVMSDPEFRQKRWFDICVAAGVLYHMHDPLRTIDLLCAAAPVIYVRTHVASNAIPAGDWTTLSDSDNRPYRAKKNVYGDQNHWGGVAQEAYWLDGTDLLRAFELRGFAISEVVHEEGVRGLGLAFLATRTGAYALLDGSIQRAA